MNSTERNIRAKAFQQLGLFRSDYSFVWEAVGNDVQTIFYFDQVKDKHMYINIYEIDPDLEQEREEVIDGSLVSVPYKLETRIMVYCLIEIIPTLIRKTNHWMKR